MASYELAIEHQYVWGASVALRTVTTLICLSCLTFFVKLVRHRRLFMRLQQQGLPMPPYNVFLGHLALLAKITKDLPGDFHGHYLASEIKRRVPGLPPIFYLDVWPTGPPLLVITSASGAYQIAQGDSQPKHEDILHFLQPLIGKHGLVTMEGEQWKYWRSIFNPGFNTAHLSTLVPGKVENTSVFCDILRERVAAGEIFSLFETMSRLTMDMSCLATLGSRLNAQRQGCDLVSAFRSQASWIPAPNELNPFKRFNPLRHLVYRHNRWRMDTYVSHELETRFKIRTRGTAPRSKAVVDLALETYLAERRESESKNTSTPRSTLSSSTGSSTGMDATFKEFAVSQMKLFLFAGYDTTASAAVYAIHLLSLHPEALKTLRAEHDAILGTDIKETATLISQQPHVLNRLPYTSATIKEALRLYPPVSSTRKSSPGFSVLSQDGTPLETDGFMLWGVHQSIHRAPEYWPSPDSFIPERWLVGPEDPLYPQKEAWRPFEKGPRNCIGQELALLEVIVILAMVLREFDFQDAYVEHSTKTGRTGPTEVRGDRAYQVLLGSSKPNNGYPCRVAAAVAEAGMGIPENRPAFL